MKENKKNMSEGECKSTDKEKDMEKKEEQSASVNDLPELEKDEVKEGKEESSKESEEAGKKDELKELQDKLAEVNDKYVRLAAEFDNYRRRTAKERLELINTAGEDIIKGFLPILDDCERALQVLGDAEVNKAAKEGTELIYNKLFNYLKSKGVERIEALGESLDTDFHEAVAQFPVQDEDKKNKIYDIVQHGYKLHGKVIRFAKVVVGI